MYGRNAVAKPMLASAGKYRSGFYKGHGEKKREERVKRVGMPLPRAIIRLSVVSCTVGVNY